MNQELKEQRELLSPPGDTILEMLENNHMSQAELAQRMGKTPSKINDLISGKEPITMNTALQLEMVLQIDAQFWLNREMRYRVKLSRIEQEEGLEECKDWLKEQPLLMLKKCGYLHSEKHEAKMVAQVLQFYGVTSPAQWQNVYINAYARASYRKSDAHKTALASMAAWLRIGEVELRKIELPWYDKEGFKTVLKQVLELVKDHPEDFAERLQNLCAAVGVAVVFTPGLPQAPISGACRWIGDRPLIQLTDRYKTNDQFWFTFFHEAGHILLHGKKKVFIESFDAYEQDRDKEQEADDFAEEKLLPSRFINEVTPGKITEKDIRRIARSYHTHPAVVLGRLQRLGKVPRYFANDMKLKVTLDYVIYHKKDR